MTSVTNQVDDTSGCGLLTGLLGEEQETLASVCSPGDVLAGGILRLLTTEVTRECLGLNWLGSEVEEFLLEDQAPETKMSVLMQLFLIGCDLDARPASLAPAHVNMQPRSSHRGTCENDADIDDLVTMN